MTPREVAAILRVTPRTVHRYGDEGRLQRVCVSRRMFRYTAESVAALMRPENETRPAGGPSASKVRDAGARPRV